MGKRLIYRAATTDGFHSNLAAFSNACANLANDTALLSDLANDMEDVHDEGTLNRQIFEAFGAIDDLEAELKTVRKLLRTVNGE